METSESYSSKEDFLALINSTFMNVALLYQGEALVKAEQDIENILAKGKGLDKIPQSLIDEIQRMNDMYSRMLFTSLSSI